MLQINGLKEGLAVFKTLGSEVRLRIVELLSVNGEMNLNEIAGALGLTNGALTAHIRKLEETGIIRIVPEYTGHGNQKRCSLNVKEVLLNVHPSVEEQNIRSYDTEIKIGHYSDFQVKPGCGMASSEGMIGEKDDARCFAYPERLHADLLWFHNGYIEYRVPNLLPKGQEILQLTISFEISSSEYGLPYEKSSDIRFYLNGHRLGSWKSFPAADEERGIYTPGWWTGRRLQHGFLKMIVINYNGAYLDGVQISEVGLSRIRMNEDSDIRFRFEVAGTEEEDGGMALFGENFGSYRQNIRVGVNYMSAEMLEETFQQSRYGVRPAGETAGMPAEKS